MIPPNINLHSIFIIFFLLSFNLNLIFYLFFKNYYYYYHHYCFFFVCFFFWKKNSPLSLNDSDFNKHCSPMPPYVGSYVQKFGTETQTCRPVLAVSILFLLLLLLLLLCCQVVHSSPAPSLFCNNVVIVAVIFMIISSLFYCCYCNCGSFTSGWVSWTWVL